MPPDNGPEILPGRDALQRLMIIAAQVNKWPILSIRRRPVQSGSKRLERSKTFRATTTAVPAIAMTATVREFACVPMIARLPVNNTNVISGIGKTKLKTT